MVLVGQFVLVVAMFYPQLNMAIALGGESSPSDMDLILQLLKHQPKNKNESNALSSSASLSSTAGEETISSSSSSSPFTVFWNLYLPSDLDKAGRVLDAMREQVHQVARSAAKEPLVLKYVTIGNLSLIMNNQMMTTLVDQTCAKYSNLECHHIKHVANGFEEVTLDELYDHCMTNDNDYNANVAYIHNKGSYNPEGRFDRVKKKTERQDAWRRHGTAAALHPHCRNLSNSSSPSSSVSFLENNKKNKASTECNVCGLFWAPLPWNHASGNFWTARCDYVRQLVRPSSFLQRMDHLVNHVYLPMVNQGRLLVSINRMLMGQSRYSMEAWVGSHPTVRPCDMSTDPDMRDWIHYDRLNATAPLDDPDGTDTVMKWALFPRHNFWTSVAYSKPRFRPRRYKKVETRLRDYNVLGGMLLRWKDVYGETTMPPDDSWIWSFYPDGEVWKQGLKTHGMAKVYEAISKPYWPAAQ